MSITAEMKKSGIIAAVKDEESFSVALSSNAGVIFLLKSALLSAEETVRRAPARGKKILLDVDLMEGIGKDEAAVKFIAEKIRPDGIITTRPNIVKCAKSKGLYTVFRVFLIDTQGLNSAIANADKLSPDAVELMPGLVPELIEKFLRENRAVIIGGLISRKEQAEKGIKAGAVAASTGQIELWG